MKKREQEYNDPWDLNSYETGSTKPPKDRGGAIAVLLVALLLVGSLCSALGILNVKLLKMLRLQTEDVQNVALFGDDETEPEPQPDHIVPTGVSVTLTLQDQPQTVPELPENGVFPWLVRIDCGAQTGSGLVMTADGYIITNAHLLSGDPVTVTFDNGLQLTASRIGADEALDVAVLQVQAAGLTPAPFGDSALLQEGDELLLVKENLQHGTAGPGGIPNDWTDTAVVMNRYGQIVGIPTAPMEGSACLMTDEMKPAVDRILDAALSKKADLCLTGCTVSDFDHRYYRLPYGVLVTVVEDDGCCEAAGIRPGDVITAVNDTRVESAEELARLIAGYQAGEQIQIQFYRPLNGQTATAELILSEAKE